MARFIISNSTPHVFQDARDAIDAMSDFEAATEEVILYGMRPHFPHPDFPADGVVVQIKGMDGEHIGFLEAAEEAASELDSLTDTLAEVVQG